MEDFVDTEWQPILAYNGLDGFDALWRLQADWFEPPNHRRGGWSGVARCELARPDGGTSVVFLKRQENHCNRSWRHPIRGAPTFHREFKHILHYRHCGIPTLEPVYFGMREQDGNRRAVLVTAELSGFVSMADQVEHWLEQGAPPRRQRIPMLRAVASLLRQMHDHGIQHNCFFPKHVFTRTGADGHIEVRIIDLEKSRWQPLRYLCSQRDLYTLNHHSLCWSRSDRLYFLLAYLGLDSLSPYAKWLWRRIAARTRRKGRLGRSSRVLKADPAITG